LQQQESIRDNEIQMGKGDEEAKTEGAKANGTRATTERPSARDPEANNKRTREPIRVSGKKRGREGANESKSGDGQQKERENERKREREREGERESQRDIERERTRESERERVYLYTTVAKIDRKHSKPKAKGSHRVWKRCHFHLNGKGVAQGLEAVSFPSK